MKFTATLTLCLAALLAASPAAAQPRRPAPALSQDRAQAIAIARVAGTVQHAELEFEHRRWIYSFEIRTANRTVMEVNVDANTGAIVEVSRD